MLAALLLACSTNFALALTIDNQLIKEVLELPVVDQCDFGYLYEQGNQDNLIEPHEILPKRR